MNITIKKLSALTMATMMAASVFAGCGQKASTTPGTGTQGSTATAAPKEVTLNFTTWVNNKDTSGAYVDENVTKAFTKKYPNIKVNFQLLTENDSNSYHQKTDLMIAGGDNIDIVQYSTRTAFYDRVGRNMLAPLDEYIAAEGKKYSDMFNIDTSMNGKIYAMPWDVKPSIVLLNKKYLDEAGLSIPKLDWTWDDFRDYAKKLTKGEGKDKRYGTYFWTTQGYKWYGLRNAYDFDPLLKKDGTSNVTDPNLKEWLKFYSDIENVDKSSFPYGEAKAGKIAYRDLFFQGKIAILPIGLWMIPEIATSNAKYPHDWVTAFAPVPKYKNFATGVTNGDACFAAVPAASKNKAEAYKLAKFNAEEGVNIRATGLPAKKDYNLDDLLKIMMAGQEKMYDVPSMKATIAGMKVQAATNIFSYSQKVLDSVDAQVEKYLVGGATLDQAIADADKAAKDIIAAEKK